MNGSAFIQKASMLYGQSDSQSLRALYTSGQARQPRSLAAANGLFTLALNEKNYPEAIAQIDLMFRLSNGNTEPLFEILGRFISDPDFQPAIAARLAKKPAWRHQYLQKMLAKDQNLDFVYKLVEQTIDTNKPSKDDKALQYRIVADLVRAGDIEKAKLYWDKYTNISATARNNLVFDPTFKDRAAMPPFNWGLYSTKISQVRSLNGGGIRIEYAGDRPISFADQIVFLEPNKSYELKITIAGDLKPERGEMNLSLRCHNGNTLITDLVINALSSRAETLTKTFSITSTECPAQKLSLRGNAGDYSVRYSAQVQKIDIVEAAQ